MYFSDSSSSSRRHSSLDEIIALTATLNGRQRSFSDSGGNQNIFYSY